MKTDITKVWATHQFQSRNVAAKWGDYGYILLDNEMETFVRLGHIYDCINPTGMISTFFLSRMEGCAWMPSREYPWSEDIVT